jgi:hypothetical protein
VTWILQADGRYHCTAHEATFASGQHCPSCDVGGIAVAPPTAAQTNAAQAAAMGLPTLLQTEKRWIAMAQKIEKLADAETNANTKTKLLGEAIKARRQATELCKRREDWLHTEKLEALERGETDGEVH